jgi:hypothetical protein
MTATTSVFAAVPGMSLLTGHIGGSSLCPSCALQPACMPHGSSADGLTSSLRARGGAAPSGTVAFATLVRPNRSEIEGTRRRPPADALDAIARHAAQLGPPSLPQPMAQPSPGAFPNGTAETSIRASVEDLLLGLVRRVAWSGDGRRGAIRLEIGAGALEGATLVVQTDDRRVSIQLNAPSGVDVHEWRARIARRLTAKGLGVDLLDVW